MNRVMRPPIERFEGKYVVDQESGCWLWTAHTSPEGYSTLSGGRKGSQPLLAHRVSYEHFVGPIPAGLHIDHLCRVRHCVNPHHLEAVTPRENTLRGQTIPAANSRKTHCVNGHPFSGANLRILPNGERRCKECARETTRRWRAKQAA